jgi:hypothetical protein
MRIMNSRPSPGMALAFVALLVALSGTAVALPGRNTVDSGDIKNRTIRGRDVRGNTLTGLDISERKLGKVPSAGKADTAGSADSATTAGSAGTAALAATALNAGTVGGQGVRKFFKEIATDDNEDIVTFGGVRLSASCAGGSTPALIAAEEPATSNRIMINGNNGNDAASDHYGIAGDFSAVDLTPGGGGATEGNGTATVVSAGGRVTTIEFGYSRVEFNIPDGCVFWGLVITG